MTEYDKCRLLERLSRWVVANPTGVPGEIRKEAYRFLNEESEDAAEASAFEEEVCGEPHGKKE